MTDEATIADGRQAWASIGRATSFAAWKSVALAVAVGRQHALRTAGVNRPFGTRYQRAIMAWLADNGFAGLSHEMRTALYLVADNLPAIEQWLSTLPDDRRAKLNHPQVIVRNWRRSREPSMPRRVSTNGKAVGNLGVHGKHIRWPGDFLARGAEAIHLANTNDCILMAKACLEAAIRGQDDIEQLLAPKPQRARQPEPAQIGAAP